MNLNEWNQLLKKVQNHNVTESPARESEYGDLETGFGCLECDVFLWKNFHGNVLYCVNEECVRCQNNDPYYLV